VDSMSLLWEDTEDLHRRVENSGEENVVDAMRAVLLEAAGGVQKSRLCFRMSQMKKDHTSELDTLSPANGEIVCALVHAKAELDHGREEYKEELKRTVKQKEESEAALIQELAVLPEGQVKRVNMLETDGCTTSFYLRLKSVRPPPKRKISSKVLRDYIQKALAIELDPLHTNASLATVCTTVFADRFLLSLRSVLREHETNTSSKTLKGCGGEDGTAPPTSRVALDKIRETRPSVL